MIDTVRKTLLFRIVQSEEPNPNLDRVRYELRATGVKPDPPNPLRSGVHSRGYLPHVKREGAAYFVTVRLADSLPKEVLMKVLAEKAERLRRLEILRAEQRKVVRSQPIPETQEEIERDYRREVERHLDKGMGECVLRRNRHRPIDSGSRPVFQ